MSRYVRSGAVFAAYVLGAIVDGVLDGGLDDVVLVLGTLAEVFGDGWHTAHSEAVAKGRAGVAVVSRLPIERAALR